LISPRFILKSGKMRIAGCLARHGWTKVMDEDVPSAAVSLREPHLLLWDERLTETDKALVAARGGEGAPSFDVLFREALGTLSK